MSISSPKESCVSIPSLLVGIQYSLYLLITFFSSEIQILNCRLQVFFSSSLKQKLKPSTLWKKSLIDLLQGTLCLGCLAGRCCSVMIGLSLCVGVTESLSGDSLHIGYPWRPVWFVAERTLHSENADHCCL